MCLLIIAILLFVVDMIHHYNVYQLEVWKCCGLSFSLIYFCDIWITIIVGQVLSHNDIIGKLNKYWKVKGVIDNMS